MNLLFSGAQKSRPGRKIRDTEIQDSETSEEEERESRQEEMISGATAF